MDSLQRETECDYTLNPNQGAWIAVNDLSIWILPNPRGVTVAIFPRGSEMEDPLDTAKALFNPGGHNK